MDHWNARVQYKSAADRDEIIGFVNRPIVTEGAHTVRLQSLDREVFLPAEDVKRIDISTLEEEGLIEMLEEVDSDAVMQFAFKLQEEKGDAPKVAGKLLVGVIQHARLIDEVARNAEEAA